MITNKLRVGQYVISKIDGRKGKIIEISRDTVSRTIQYRIIIPGSNHTEWWSREDIVVPNY